MRVAAIVPAAGLGRRLGASRPKAFVPVAGKTLLEHTLEALARAHRFDSIVVAVARPELAAARRLLARSGVRGVRTVVGGKTRAESVWRALETVGDSDFVLVHDAARPLVTRKLVGALLKEARRSGAVIPGTPPTATVKRVDSRGRVAKTEDRSSLVLAQTPQVFRRDWLLGAYRRLGARAFLATDEAQLFDGSPRRVSVLAGDPDNVKITTREDLAWLKARLRGGR